MRLIVNIPEIRATSKHCDTNTGRTCRALRLDGTNGYQEVCEFFPRAKLKRDGDRTPPMSGLRQRDLPAKGMKRCA